MPLTILANAQSEDILSIFHGEGVYILFVADDKKKLTGIISRKNMIATVTEKVFWPQAEFQKLIAERGAKKEKGGDSHFTSKISMSRRMKLCVPNNERRSV